MSQWGPQQPQQPYQPPPQHPQQPAAYPPYAQQPPYPQAALPLPPRRRQFGCWSGCGAIILLLIVGTIIGTIAESLKSTNSSQAQVPTETPAPPQPLVGATLGGTKAGFVSYYGPTARLSGQDTVHYHTAGSGLDVAIFLTQYKAGSDRQAHLSIVQVVLASGETWEAVNEQTICGFLRPDDAAKFADVTVHLGAGITADEWIYQSAALAATFPAADFVDHAGHSVPPGTFVIDYLPDLHNGADPYGGTGHCELSLGKY